jgi:signal transduction histidine kinase
LGLAIVKHLCQALQASLTVRSRLGEGSEFTVRFPRV